MLHLAFLSAGNSITCHQARYENCLYVTRSIVVWSRRPPDPNLSLLRRSWCAATSTCAAIWLTVRPAQARSRICCLFAAPVGRQTAFRMLPDFVVSHTPAAGATLDLLDSGATSPAMRRLRKASRGSQLFELMLPTRCTNVSSQHHEGLQTRTRSSVSSACSGPCRFHRLDPRHR